MSVLQRRLRRPDQRAQVAGVRLLRDPGRRAAAHLLGRLTMAPNPGRVESLAERSTQDVIASIFDDDLIQQHQSLEAPTTGRTSADDDDGELRSDDISSWWLTQMTEPDNGIVDRMAWFWHGHLTTNADKVSDPLLIGTQLNTLRRGGLGNFRTLLHDVVTGGAMLQYLDASYSEASNPNENLARELMELFTMGRGHYDEDDVRSAARALAGWIVESEDDRPATVTWHRDRAFVAPLLFLGEQANWDTAMVIDRLCDDPATAEHVASKLWDHLVRRPLTDQGRADLGSWWRTRDLEIRPLVERICTDAGFVDSVGSGTRSPIEWWCAATAATGFEHDDIWSIHRLGQFPFAPPNVGGWPAGNRWLSPGSVLARSAFAYGIEFSELDELPSTTDAILDRCSLFDIDPTTHQAIEAVADTPDIDRPSILAARWRLALCSPEFQLS